ncbi:endonuclease III [Lentibacillus kapialis]|uniref:Endonuclease III n=1 Tax=Lentibacillus kapialis TaxID=340214 RepID=A0A917UYD0_9BACI|nr:endonuclease III domain-containing protein [Lentibacillus kapialis]GGJ96117.1 endonuclease III [Lentibacillus kapialis]
MTISYEQLYSRLFDCYGPQNWWPAETPLEMMVGAILVQNTNWRNAEKALLNVEPYLFPESLESLTTDELAQMIRPSGFFNIKAKRIKAFLEWFKTYHYDVERVKESDKQQLRNELLDINGIGRETADAMLLYVFAKPLFVVDNYARRIFYRIGFDMPTTYDGFQNQVENAISGDVQLFNEFHALLVEHAKIHCRKTPVCQGCPLVDVCARRLD